MIWIPVLAIAGGVFAVSFSKEMTDTRIGEVLSIIVTIPLFAILGALLGICTSYIAGMLGLIIVPTKDVFISDLPIYSLADNAEYNGRFVLGSGQVDGDLKIYYVAQADDGKKIEKADRSNVVIVESDEQPHAVVTGKRYKWYWVNLFMLDIHEMFGDKVTLTVPKNTVTTEYNIDLK